jgi:glyoxylase-like metal-dependent hydrolase (beta-lactamase superfamily II)
MNGLARRFGGWRALALVMTIGSGTFSSGLVQTIAGHAAQARPAGVKLYVMDGGWLKDQPPASYELTREQVPDSDMSVPVFLVVHPRGTLVWDTGLGDRFADGKEMPANKSWQVQRTVRSQLAEIGYKPEAITYLAISHSHGDHTGNANDYAASTWLVQKAERDLMFGEKPPRTYDAYKALKDSKTKLLEGDYDVFGDGSVVIKSTPGHTPGHQALYVRLTSRQPVVLSGDLYHFPQERTLDKVPTFEFNKDQTRASRAALEAFMKLAGAELWIQHDTATWAKLLKSPKFYQ